jgi:hypothetical protein
MGAQDVKSQGFFTNNTKGNDFAYSPGCGGSGAVMCHLPASFRYMAYKIPASAFVVKNRQLILQNNGFKQYYDAGFDGICGHSNGASANYDVYLAYDWNGTFDITKTTNKVRILGTATLPFYMTFNDAQLPQPDNIKWTGYIWVITDLLATGMMIGDKPFDEKIFKTSNHDFDERL